MDCRYVTIAFAVDFGHVVDFNRFLIMSVRRMSLVPCGNTKG
jgi:hypothetical protein